jgi:hypothetical protein
MKSRAVPAALVLAIATVTLCAAGSAAYWRGQQSEPLTRFLDVGIAPLVDEAFLSYPVEYALRSDEANDVIFLGDSTCHDDIDPARLKGLRSYNLGSVGSIGPLGILLTANAYLSHHPKPRAIVLCVSPLRFEVSTDSAGGHVVRRFMGSYGPQVPGIVPLHESIEYFAKCGAQRFAERPGVGVLWDAPLRGLDSETYLSLERRMRASRGFFALPKEHGGRWNVEMPAPPKLILPEWDDGVRRLAETCESAKVRLIIRFAPIWDGASKSRDFGQLEAWSQKLEDAFPCVIVPRPVIIAWDREMMWDGLHLNSRGVEAFMPVVAKDVQAALGK